jgi:hypothetical protein
LGNSPRLGLKIYEDPKRGSFPNMMNLLQRVLQNRTYLMKTGTFHFIRFLKFGTSSSRCFILGGALKYTSEIYHVLVRSSAKP